jgi:type IV fimbrial biogenesis protein FimT
MMPPRFAPRKPARTPGRKPGARGFSMMELLIVIAIVGILTSLALPSMTEFVRDQRVKAATQDVFGTLLYARSEAIKRSADVNVDPVGTDWAGGWTVKAGAESLRVQETISAVTISGPASGAMTFRRDGRLSAAVPIFVVSSPASSAITARCVRIDPSGRASILADTNHDPADGCN